jgi:hypothetical protein
VWQAAVIIGQLPVPHAGNANRWALVAKGKVMCQFCNDNPNECAYASTCAACGKKYFGNGYGNVELLCHDCLKSKHAKSISKSKWYLVRRECGTPWTFHVLLHGFKTAAQAEAYPQRWANYLPIRGEGVLERQVDESLGLVKIVYMTAGK